MREQIRALVPSALLDSGRLKAEGTITRVDKRFRLNLVLHLREISGERTIDSDSCNDLAGAAAVALGLLLQSATQSGSGEPATAPGAPASAAGAASSETPTSSAQPNAPKDATSPVTPASTRPTLAPNDGSARPRNFRVFLHAPQLSVDLGPLPKPRVGLVVAAGFSMKKWRFAASFELPRAQHLSLPGSAGAGAELQHWAVESWTCRAWQSAGLELAPCLLIGWDRLKATGTGPGVAARSERASWGSLGAATLGRWYVAEWFALAVSVGVKVEGARPAISIDGIQDYGRLQPVALLLRTGPVWIF